MAEPKAFASLSSGLLARKGGAKPAMRPQGFSQMGVSLEDLGWNDMGHGQGSGFNDAPEPEPAPEHVPSSIAALTPSPRLNGETTPAEQAVPPQVIQQQRVIETVFAEQEAPAAAPKAAPAVRKLAQAPRGRKAAPRKARAAFTLRLDADRHLKLRLACALKNQSAQQLVSDALDKFLASVPELDALAGKLPARGRQN